MKILAVAIAVVCFVLAALYWTGAVQFGAHKAGPHHTHATLFIVLGVLSLVWLRFQSASASAQSR